MRELLSLLPKPSRYLGIEEGSVRKDPDQVRLRVGLVFPDMYEVGMSYLGQKILYSIVNERPHWQAERVFTPCREAGKVLREHNAPLCTLESDTPLDRMDVLGISVTHELCYSNILYVLDLAGIPLRAEARREPRPDGRPWPLIVAGGGCALAAEPLAPFVDAMVLGEAEAALPEALECVERGRGLARRELLLELSRIPGLYIPEFFTPEPDGSLRPLHDHHRAVVRRVVPDMDKAPYPALQPIPFGAVHNRLALEIGRGCTRGCRFCQAGSIYRPARERSVAGLQALLNDCLSATGFDDVSYLSLSTGDFSALKELFMNTVDRCADEQVSVSLPSLRVGSIDDAIMERMAGIRRTGATLAPEAGSQRLRDVINKGVSEDDLILHVRKLFEHGWQQVKLYFMIGLPTETDDDLLAIVDLCRKARDAAGPGIKRLQITAAVSPFVPKAHTPFQWEAQISLEEIRRRVGVLLDAVKKEKRIKLRWHEPEMSVLEGLFSRGDRRLAEVVESAYRKGAIFTSWKDDFTLEPWLEALAERGLTLEEYAGARPLDAPLPWDHLHSGVSREFFLRERAAALQGKTAGDCRYETCRLCGVCDTAAGPSGLERGPDMPEGASYGNILNKAQRDQQTHGVALDKYGRVVVRHREDGKVASPEGGASGNGASGAEIKDSPGTEAPAVKADNARGGESPAETAAGESSAAPRPTKPAKSKPPALAPHLIKKVAQWRILYSRTGPAAYISQLEMQHIFDRALRRARIPLSFSQGFHPLPLVSFGRALPVGVAGNREWFSLFLREERRPEEAVELLNKALPQGVRVLAVEILPPGEKCVDAVRESYRMECFGPEAQGREFSAAWARVAAAASLPWRREGKKGPRDLDARTFFADIICDRMGSCDLVVDWSGGYVSPLALCLGALAAVGHEAPLRSVRLTRLT